MPITIGGAAVGLIGEGVNLYNNYDARGKAQAQLNAMQGQQPEQYAATPQLQHYYSGAINDATNPQGYTGGQRANFNYTLANNNNTVFKNATATSGGNISKYISAALNTKSLGAINDFASRDAALKMANRNSALGRQYGAVGQFQDISNKNVAAKNYRQQLIAQALGGAISQQNQNIAGAYNNFSNAGFTAAGYGLSGLINKPKAPAPVNDPYNFKTSTGGADYTQPDYSQPFYG